MSAKILVFPLLHGVRASLANAYRAAANLVDWDKWEVVLRPVRSRRTLEQNSRMWAMLTDIAEQLPWSVDGKLVYISKEDWKDLLTAALDGEMRVAAGINGGIVLLGRSTRKMTIQQMSDLIEMMQAFGAERGIRFSAPKGMVPEYYEDAA